MTDIRTLDRIEDYKKIPAIEKDAWGFPDPEVEPHFLMTRSQKYGGLVQGLFIDGEMIGFSYALPGRWKGEFFIYSHMVAVLREHQGKGYGFLLKKAQREALLGMGYDTVRWNFDPLEAMNAFFNIHRLGALSEEYERDVYGTGEHGLHKGLTTDRLIATWPLASERVAKRMEEKIPATLKSVSSHNICNFGREVTYVECPGNIREIKEKDMALARQWRQSLRESFEAAFSKGFVLEEMVYTPSKESLYYQLRKR